MNPGTKLFAIVWLGFATLSLGKAVSDLVDWQLSSKILNIRNRVLKQTFDKVTFNKMDEQGDGKYKIQKAKESEHSRTYGKHCRLTFLFLLPLSNLFHCHCLVSLLF